MAEKEFGVISQAKNLAEHTFRHSTDIYVEELLNKSSKIRRNKYG